MEHTTKNQIIKNILSNIVDMIDNVDTTRRVIKIKRKDIPNLPPTKIPLPIQRVIVANRGTGAGGANTNYHGKKFEYKTDNTARLLEMGYKTIQITKTSKKDFSYLEKIEENKTTVFVLQHGLKIYMKHKYGIELFRCPDEAYIVEYTDGNKIIKVLEKKEQNQEGSVETKLWSGPSLKREYELVLGPDFIVDYAFCVNDFLQKKLISNEKKYEILQTIFCETRITLLYGDDADYFDTLDRWLNNS